MIQNERLLLFLMIVALVACCIATDISVPSFPDMAKYFATTEEYIQRTMSINFLGFCVAGLLYGPLSDAFGRRRVILLGSLFFLIGGIGSSLATSIEFLIFSRLIQGIGQAAAAVVAMAIISDCFQGERASRFIGVMNGVLTAAMAGAPILGGFIHQYFGWRANYLTVAVMSLVSILLLWRFLPETKRKLEPFKLRDIFSGYKTLLTSPTYVALAMAPSLLIAAYLSFVSIASFLYINHFGIPMLTYAFYQGGVIAAFSLTSFFSGDIQKFLGNRWCVIWGVILSLIGSFGLAFFGVTGWKEPILISLCMCFNAVGNALCYGIVFAACMDLYPELKGASSSLLMSLRTLAIAVSIEITGMLYAGTLLSPSLVILANILGGLVLIVYLRAHLFRAPSTPQLELT